jgi:hypothetical protein
MNREKASSVPAQKPNFSRSLHDKNQFEENHSKRKRQGNFSALIVVGFRPSTQPTMLKNHILCFIKINISNVRAAYLEWKEIQ